MGEIIFYILACIVMLILLISTIYSFIRSIKTDKQFDELNKKHLEYVCKQLEKLQNIEPVERDDFKVGDKAELIKLNGDCDNGFKVGDTVTILEIDCTGVYELNIENEEGFNGFVDREQLIKIKEDK